MNPIPFDDFIQAIAPLEEGELRSEPDQIAVLHAGAQALQAMPRVTVRSLTAMIRQEPEWIRVLGLSVGLSQEQLKTLLTYRFGSSSYRKAALSAQAVVEALDALGLVEAIKLGRRRTYSYADLLLERYGSRSRAGRAIGRGRRLEDAVQAVVEKTGLPYEMRGTFIGRGDQEAPCDLAIPCMGIEAEIVVAIKGFGSTGSKLTDAVREVKQMVDVRRPTQFVFAVFDGVGWLNRRNDLRKVHRLWIDRHLNGLYTSAHLPQFGKDLAEIAPRVRLRRD